MTTNQSDSSTVQYYIEQILDFKQYKIDDHVATRYMHTRDIIICGIIKNISILDQQIQILLDVSSELVTIKANELVGRIKKVY